MFNKSLEIWKEDYERCADQHNFEGMCYALEMIAYIEKNMSVATTA